MKDSKEKSAGFKKLFAENNKINRTYKPKKRHTVKNQHKSAKSKHNHKAPKKVAHNNNNKESESTKSKKVQYSNIRTKLSTVDELHGYQVACGFKSRDDLLNEMIKVCKPVLLNSSTRKKRYHKTLKLIHLARALKNTK